MIDKIEIALKNVDFDFQGVNQEVDTDDSLYEVITDADISQYDILELLFAMSEIGLIYIDQQTDVSYEDNEGDEMKYMNIYYFAIAYKKNSETIIDTETTKFEE